MKAASASKKKGVLKKQEIPEPSGTIILWF